jgi:hypothetical protein
MSGATVSYEYFDEQLSTTEGTKLIDDETERTYVDLLFNLPN